MSSIDEIKARIDIVDLVSETVQLRRSGKNYTGFCPFHSNTRTPAFVVFPETGTWRCFGQCNEGGDIFGFVMKKEGWDFSEALKNLAERAGIDLRPPTPQEIEAAEEHEALRALLEEAVTFYRHNLFNTPAGKAPLEYLRQKRSLKDDTIEAFGLGYAPDAWEAGRFYFKDKGHSEAELLDAGLVTQRAEEAEAGTGRGRTGLYDRFRNRLMFPIRDERGRMAGFGARIMDPQDVPKFLNTPQTAVFDKGHLLYGLDRARKAIRAQDQAVIVEGYLDVIALHQAGFANAVSPMGTALTEAQLRLLKRFSRRMVLALDADAAGDKATLRGLQVARQALERESDPVFDARGLLGYEGRLQADIRVTALPAGLDPDEVVLRDPQEWERILANARPVVVHVMETLAGGRDLDDPKTRSEIASQVLPLIEDVADTVERESYRQRLARLLHVDERALVGARGRGGAARPRPRALSVPAAGVEKRSEDGAARLQDGGLALEDHCLGVLLRRPDLVYRVDRMLVEAGLERVSSVDFESADHQLIVRLMEESLGQDRSEPFIFVLNSLPLPLMELADRLLGSTEKLDPNEERVLDDLFRSLLAMRRVHLSQQIDHLRYLMEEAQQTGDLQLREHQQSMQQYILTRSRLDRALGQVKTRSEQ